MTFTGPGREIRERELAEPETPPRVNQSPLLGDLPDWATVREAVPHLSYEQAVHVAGSILNDIKRGTLTRPYPENVRHSLRVCAAVLAREATV